MTEITHNISPSPVESMSIAPLEKPVAIEGVAPKDMHLIHRIATVVLAARELTTNAGIYAKVRFNKQGDTFTPEVKIVDTVEQHVKYDSEYPFDLTVDSTDYPSGTLGLGRSLLAPATDPSYPQALGVQPRTMHLTGRALPFDGTNVYTSLNVHLENASGKSSKRGGGLSFDFSDSRFAKKFEKKATFDEDIPIDTASSEYYALAEGLIDIAEATLQATAREVNTQQTLHPSA